MVTLVQSPAPGERRVHFVGDTLDFALRVAGSAPWPAGWRAFLRTNLGRAAAARAETIASVESCRPPTLASWRDLPLVRRGEGWAVEMPLPEVGYFRAKAYALDEKGWQHWPDGPDFGVSVQPAGARTGNTVYCAFTRLFGPTRSAAGLASAEQERRLEALDAAGYSVIPASGKLRDLIRELPHIFEVLGCRILHLLPVHPTPTTYARFGRFGSPYACGDLEAIDPALIEFDRRTTGIDQFRELTYAVHRWGGRVFLDIVVNHTGWGSRLQERHPDWFQRDREGRFVSPGAWGTTWEDLVELDHSHADLRQYLGEALLEWCRRGVDGFRCDAAYKVPIPVWQYVTARVRQEYPDTVFLVEGLGGAWEDTERLLTEGGMQWAYSELFQNLTGLAVAGYLDHAFRQSQRSGILVHYSETHDNDRLAARGRAWSLMRNRLCALASVAGGFGFTCGVEWLAREKIKVHSSPGLAWGGEPNLVGELGRLNRLLLDHPCFFDGAKVMALADVDSPVYALLRVSAEGRDAVLVVANLDVQAAQPVRVPVAALTDIGLRPETWVDLLDQSPPSIRREAGLWTLAVPPAAVFCLAAGREPRGLAGDAYRRQRAWEAAALSVLAHYYPVERLGGLNIAALGGQFARDPAAFLSAVAAAPPGLSGVAIGRALKTAAGAYPAVVVWTVADRTRVVPIPPGHWLMVWDTGRFRARLSVAGEAHPRNVESTAVAGGFVVCFSPPSVGGEAELLLERYGDTEPRVAGGLRYLEPGPAASGISECATDRGMVLLTNDRGGMARLAVDFGAVRSKYDCLLGANLDPSIPVDRHIFAKRARVWVNADGFISPLNAANLDTFQPGPPARWRFVAPAGDGRTVVVELTVWMPAGANTTVLRFECPRAPNGLAPGRVPSDVRLTVRVDLEDRSFHGETRRNAGAEHHFASHCHALSATAPQPEGARSAGEDAGLSRGGQRVGFAFTPAADRQFRVWADAGAYHPQPEWSENVPHPVEGSRGQASSGDAFSPGWFELPLASGTSVTLVASAELADPGAIECDRAVSEPPGADSASAPDSFGPTLLRAARSFLVRRDGGKTVIAGYPWFVDWGRDTLICARGLLAAGLRDEVTELLRVFGQFERHGTLPNSLRGADASDRDTSDAPLWFGLACEALAGVDAGSGLPRDASQGQRSGVYGVPVSDDSRTLGDVLAAIGAGYLRGAPNGIAVDRESALVWSPSHFTWMDTNYPAGTPREGYPIEIQALWIRLLQQLERLGFPAAAEPWGDLARRAIESMERFFWLEAGGFYADVLLAPRGQSAAKAVPHRALRCNTVFPIALGLVAGERARRTVQAVERHLLVPGALRSLAPLPVSPPLPIRGAGGLLNDPDRPYWGRYEGDEDTRRKPAYHNGTAWVWPFPSFCEALVRAWEGAPAAVAAARAYLGSVDRLLVEGCIGHLPEILDGDAPHTQRGCDAQAWSVTEVLRVWRWLECQPLPEEPFAVQTTKPCHHE